MVVGEDLDGPGNRSPCDATHGILRTYVAQQEAGSGGLPEPPAESVAALNTHDMPTWAGFWRGADVPLRQELGLIDRSQADEIHRAAERPRGAAASLPGSGLRTDLDGENPRASLEASLERLAASGAAIITTSLGDLLRPDPERAGHGSERPNWRRRYPWTLEELQHRPVTSVLERIDRIRDDGSAGAEPRDAHDHPHELTADDLPLRGGDARPPGRQARRPPPADGTSFAVWARTRSGFP